MSDVGHWGAAVSRDAESSLYEPVEHYLNIGFFDNIRPSLGTVFLTSEITALNARGPEGRWSRPDLAAVAVWRRKFDPTIHLDLYGFEVKPAKRGDVSWVHEALAHTRYVHFAYLVWNWSAHELYGESYEAIEDSCKAYGIGLIIAHDPGNPQKYLLQLQAARMNPSLDIVDQFIEAKFSQQKKDRLLQAMRDLWSGP